MIKLALLEILSGAILTQIPPHKIKEELGSLSLLVWIKGLDSMTSLGTKLNA